MHLNRLIILHVDSPHPLLEVFIFSFLPFGACERERGNNKARYYFWLLDNDMRAHPRFSIFLTWLLRANLLLIFLPFAVFEASSTVAKQFWSITGNNVVLENAIFLHALREHEVCDAIDIDKKWWKFKLQIFSSDKIFLRNDYVFISVFNV